MKRVERCISVNCESNNKKHFNNCSTFWTVRACRKEKQEVISVSDTFIHRLFYKIRRWWCLD